MKMKVNEKEEENNKENKENEIEGYLDIYEGFWKKFEILFQSLNLYSYLFLRDNKEKVRKKKKKKKEKKKKKKKKRT